MNAESRIILSVRYRLPLAILSVIGTITILLSTRHYGAGLSPDSVGYIATARHIATGIGPINYNGTPLLAQPPLYPALLATIDYVLGIDPLSSAPIVNAALYGFIIYLSGLLFLKHFKSFAFAFLGTASVLVAIPLIRVSLMAWSEPLFIFFLLLYLILSESHVMKADTTSLLLLSLTVALLCLTRYIGVIFILTGVVSILLFRRNSLSVTFRHLFLFVFISVLPIGMWIIRNYFLSGTLFGPRAPSNHSLFQNLAFTFNTVLSWYIPRRISAHRPILMLLSSTIGFLAGLSARGNWSKIRTALLDISPFLLVIIAYVGFLVVSSTTTAYDPIDNRLLSPVFVPITLLLLFIASKIPISLTAQPLYQKRANVLAVAIIAVWLVYPARITMSLILHTVHHGLGFSSEFWRKSQTIEYLLQNRTVESKCGVIYTNAPEALYILADLTAKMSPLRTMYNSPEIVNDISSLRGSWPEESNSYLVWFDKIDRQHLFTVDELQTIANLQQIVRFEDGAVYYAARK